MEFRSCRSCAYKHNDNWCPIEDDYVESSDYCPDYKRKIE